MTDTSHTAPAQVLMRALPIGFAAAVAVWVAWFITHSPWVGMAETQAIPLLIGVWILTIAAATAGDPARRTPLVGLVAGLICALVSFLALGSKAMPHPDQAAATPPVYLIVPGFLALGAVLGLIGGAIGGLVGPRGRAELSSADLLGRFAIVVAVGVTPLLFVGGLVTSTGSGMAFPDWPTSAGLNMFLYPLGPRTPPDKYLEHSHRLFGTLVGLMSIVLMVWILAVDRRRWVKVLGITAFLLVTGQGLLGAWRVLSGSTVESQDSPMMAMLHGILAQVVFAFIVGLAATLSPLFRSDVRVSPNPGIRRFKVFGTAFTHVLLLQLILGAAYRHLRGGHALWSHAGFSLIVVVAALLAAFTLLGLARPAEAPAGEPGQAEWPAALRRAMGRIGLALVIVVAVQFALGWVAFFAGGQERTAATAGAAFIRTAHQANGAVAIALAALVFVWSRWLVRRARA